VAPEKKNEQAILTIETCKACKVDLIALHRPALDKQNVKGYSPTALTYLVVLLECAMSEGNS
tara:strand:- start:1 stop:186 length:186 start_codon:yes stop_codon:yes gene_type:complete